MASWGRVSHMNHPARTKRMSARKRDGQARRAHIVVVGVAHFQTSVPFDASAVVIIADNVFKGVAAAPLPSIAPNIALHGV